MHKQRINSSVSTCSNPRIIVVSYACSITVVTPAQAGPLIIMASASNRAGATQTFDLIANPAGYHHNVVQRISLNAA